MRTWLLGLLLVASVARGDQTPPAPKGAKFRHDTHAKKAKNLDVKQCARCHAAKPDGTPARPGADGHKPCMTSGCHLEKGSKGGGFLDKSSTICLGCHDKPDNFSKNPATRVFKGNPRPEHYVEFDHDLHMDKKGLDAQAGIVCTNCHWVDKSTFSAVEHPGHPQCAQCHDGKDKAHAMETCAGCHLDGDPAQHFTKKRPGVRMREGVFTHEHVGHRFWDKETRQKPMQCSTCHTRVDKAKDLASLRGMRLITGGTMQGVCAKCHDVVSGNLCNLCHTEDIKGTDGSFHFLME
jgi:cytochrome c553